MIRYLEPLYVTEKSSEKVDEMKRKIKWGAGMIGLYLITLSSNENDVFDIFSVVMMKQRSFRHRDLDVIGVAEDQEAAFMLVQRIHEEYYAVCHSYSGIRDALSERLCEQEKKG